MKKILMGIGSELQGDDGIGTIIAKELKNKEWLSLVCDTVPENFAGVVEREKPELLVLVDAAEMNLPAGSLRRLPTEKLNSLVIGTHGIPLKHLVSRLEKASEKTIFIGVQPGKIRFGDSLSEELKQAKQKLLSLLERNAWQEIERIS